jgi:hypothetical protein
MIFNTLNYNSFLVTLIFFPVFFVVPSYFELVFEATQQFDLETKEKLTEEQQSMYVTNGLLFIWQLTTISLVMHYFRQKDIATIIIDQVKIQRQ